MPNPFHNPATVAPSPAAVNESIDSMNAQLAPLPPAERMGWAVERFGNGLYATTSAGRDSAIMWDTINRVAPEIPLTLVDTRFLHPVTLEHVTTLTRRFGELTLHTCGPSPEEVADVTAERTWEVDPERFMDVVKIKPLAKQAKELGVTALMSAIHRDQTENRDGLDILTRREDGTYRIHPFLDWTEADMRAYMRRYDLPENPLPLLRQGVDHRRIVYSEGETALVGIAECGLHVVDGIPTRRKVS